MFRSVRPSSSLVVALLSACLPAAVGRGAAEEEILCRCHHGAFHARVDHAAAAAAAGEPAARQYAPDR
ncbi:MAG: hypothetical protein ACKO9B_07685, partial [Planctomycetota bacterium]